MYRKEQGYTGRNSRRSTNGFRTLTKDVLRSPKRELPGRYSVGKTYGEVQLVYGAIREGRLRSNQLGGYFAKELATVLRVADNPNAPDSLADAIDRAGLSIAKLKERGFTI